MENLITYTNGESDIIRARVGFLESENTALKSTIEAMKASLTTLEKVNLLISQWKEFNSRFNNKASEYIAQNYFVYDYNEDVKVMNIYSYWLKEDL